MSDDTARRERAEEWANERGPRGHSRSRDRLLWIEAANSYLAGAREEAAEKDKEIAALRLDNGELALVIETEAIQAKRIMSEIAALREQLKDARAQIEGLENELIEVREMSDE